MIALSRGLYKLYTDGRGRGKGTRSSGTELARAGEGGSIDSYRRSVRITDGGEDAGIVFYHRALDAAEEAGDAVGQARARKNLCAFYRGFNLFEAAGYYQLDQGGKADTDTDLDCLRSGSLYTQLRSLSNAERDGDAAGRRRECISLAAFHHSLNHFNLADYYRTKSNTPMKKRATVTYERPTARLA